MNQTERDEFLGFCLQATDRQLECIVEKERDASESGDPHRATCAGIAEGVAAERGLSV